MTMMNTKTFAQSYGKEGPTLSRNALGLVYEGAIEKNVPGKVNIQKVSYMVDGIKAVANVYTPAGYKKDGSYAAIVVARKRCILVIRIEFPLLVKGAYL